ncbi:DUF962 domain-containing protein [Microbulbifer sediminum]|uniref:DUF962 domain-containing protein n=1 Tax=Microbulbifer sediminum TaxID=2904250 RepID=UPI001F41D4D2|nr:DUF962 domain-containing protein [Microbulbifer sediminum]
MTTEPQQTEPAPRDGEQPQSQPQEEFGSFADFYPFYLNEHANLTCRRLHFVGTLLVIALLLTTAFTGNLLWLLAVPVAGYGFAWAGHFFFEHNRPATFKHPLYSLLGDFVMFRDMLLGRIER